MNLLHRDDDDIHAIWIRGTIEFGLAVSARDVISYQIKFIYLNSLWLFFSTLSIK